MVTVTALPQDPAPERRSARGTWVVLAGIAAVVVVFVAAARSGGGDGGARVGHLEAVLPVPPEHPPGVWSLDLTGRSAVLLPPNALEHSIGEVLRYDDETLELGPHPDCDGGGGGMYDVSVDRGTVTFDVVGTDGCRPRQDLLTAGPWRSYTPPPRTDELPDATPATVLATVPVDARAAHLTIADGSVWVAPIGSRDVVRVDLTTNTVTERVDVGYADEIPGISAGDGAVWVTSWLRDTVTRIDPGSNEVTASIDVGEDPPGGILVADGEVWVANAHDGTVSRIDTGTNAVADAIAVAEPGDGGPQEVVAFDGRVLVAVPRDNEIASIDPSAGAVTRFHSGRVASRLAVTPEAVWSIEGLDATWVTRIGADGVTDLRVGVGEGRHPRALAADGDVLWVLTATDESPTLHLELLRIDGRTGEVTRRQEFTHMTQRMDIVVDDGGDVWVTGVKGVLRIDGGAD